MTAEDAPIDGRHGGEITNLRARAVKGVFWTAASNWGDQLARLLVFVILSRLLDPVAFGLVALALVFVGFTEVIAEQGLVDALVQRRHLDSDHLDTAFWMGAGFGALLGLVLAALAVPIALLLDQSQLAPVLVALALVIPIASSSLVQRAILTREMAFRPLALRTLISIGVGSVVGVSAALLGFGVWSLVAQSLTVQLTKSIVLWRVTDWRPRLTFNYSHFRDLFRFGKHVVGVRLLNYSNRNADNFVVGSVLGPESLGFYVVGYRILRLVIQVTTSLIDKVAFPLYSRLQDEPERLRRAYYKSGSFVALTAFPAFIGILILAPEIVSVVFGAKWEKSVPVMQILAVFGIVRSLSYLNSSTLTALGKPSWQLVITGITAILNMGAFLLAARHGIVAVAIAVLAVGYLTAPISYWAVNRLVPIDVWTYLRQIRGPLLGSIVLSGVMLGLRYLLGSSSPALTLGVVSAAGAVAYIAAIRLLAPPLAVEVRELVRGALPAPKVTRPAGLSSRR